jgi:hypothetical protein
MEKVQVIKEAFSRFIRPGHDHPRAISQFSQLGVQEHGESQSGGGAMQPGE